MNDHSVSRFKVAIQKHYYYYAYTITNLLFALILSLTFQNNKLKIK